MKGNWVTINDKSGSGSGGNYFSNSTQGGGYSTSGTSGGSYSVGSYNSAFLSSYSGYGNSQGLGKLYEPEEVLGMSGHTAKNPYGDSQTIDQIVEHCNKMSNSCWGSNAILCGGGKGYMKAINLGRTDMHDRDSGNLFYTLRNYNFNLEILNLSNNRIGDLGVESMIYGITSLQYQTLYSADNGWKPYQSNLKTVQNIISINLSNNQIGDGGAKLLADYLANGSFSNTKSIDVSGNQITTTGEGYFAKALESAKVTSITVVLTAKNSLKEIANFIKTGFNYYAKEFHIEQIAMDGESQKYLTNCQKVGVNVTSGFVSGVMKCNQLPNKKIAFFCLIKEVISSIAQPETLNCLADIHKFFEYDVTSLTGASSDQDIHQDCNIF
jgi:hypothetical protein